MVEAEVSVEQPKNEPPKEPTSIEEEIDQLDELTKGQALVSDDFSWRYTYEVTPIKMASLICRFPETYPNSPLYFDLRTQTIPFKLIEKIKRKAENELVKIAKEGKYGQSGWLFKHFLNIMENNNLIQVFEEIAPLQSLMTPKDELKFLERAGKIRVKIVNEKDRFALVEIFVPSMYPQEQAKVTLIETTIDPLIAQIFMIEAEEITKLYHTGRATGDRIKVEKKLGTLNEDFEKMTSMTREEMKHDMDYFKRMGDLKNSAMDKESRKQLKWESKKEKWYEEEMLRKKEYQDSLNKKHLIKSGQPSVYAVVDYIANKFVRYLPKAKCLGCENSLAFKLKKGEEDPMRPQRLYCGHWFHDKCLDEFVNSPPFARECPQEGCQQRVGNQKYPNDDISVKNREKQWSQDQARKGEMSDIDRLLGL